MYGFDVIYLPFPKLIFLIVFGTWLKWKILLRGKCSHPIKHSVTFTVTNILIGLFILPWIPISFDLAKPKSLFLIYFINISAVTIGEFIVGAIVLKDHDRDLKKLFAANFVTAVFGVAITIHNVFNN